MPRQREIVADGTCPYALRQPLDGAGIENVPMLETTSPLISINPNGCNSDNPRPAFSPPLPNDGWYGPPRRPRISKAEPRQILSGSANGTVGLHDQIIAHRDAQFFLWHFRHSGFAKQQRLAPGEHWTIRNHGQQQEPSHDILIEIRN